MKVINDYENFRKEKKIEEILIFAQILPKYIKTASIESTLAAYPLDLKLACLDLVDRRKYLNSRTEAGIDVIYEQMLSTPEYNRIIYPYEAQKAILGTFPEHQENATIVNEDQNKEMIERDGPPEETKENPKPKVSYPISDRTLTALNFPPALNHFADYQP